MRKKEISFVADVLAENPRFREAEDLDWYFILGYLELNKVCGYFYGRARELGVPLPQGVLRRLAQTAAVQEERNEQMRKYIGEIGKKLKGAKIGYAFLKGSVLSNANLRMSELAFTCFAHSSVSLAKYESYRNDVFYKAGERVSNDVDLLVRPADVGAVSAILKDMGFVQGYYDFFKGRIVGLDRAEIVSRRMNRGETAPFLKKTAGSALPFIEVDVNFSLGYLPNGNGKMLDEILENAVDYAGLIDGGVRGLSAGDFFAHLIMHQYKESSLYSMVERGKDLELYKFLDLYLFIKRGLVDFTGLSYLVKKYGLERETYAVLSDLARIFDDLPLEGFLDTVRPRESEAEVSDPASGKKYTWRADFDERLAVFEKCRLLEIRRET